MTAPNTQTSSLVKILGDGNPDGIASTMEPVITGNATGNQTIAANSGIIGGIFVHTPTANLTLTLDTAANFANQFYGTTTFPSSAANSVFFDFTVQNLGNTANQVTTVAAGTGGATSGVMTLANTTSGSFRCLVTGSANYTIYRR